MADVIKKMHKAVIELTHLKLCICNCHLDPKCCHSKNTASVMVFSFYLSTMGNYNSVLVGLLKTSL